MQAYTYVEKGKFALLEKPKPVLLHERDAIVKVTLASIAAFPGLFQASRWDMRWWALWNRWAAP